MMQIKARRTIEATPEKVFLTTAHIENMADVVPEITNVEFLSEQKTGVGTRFKETRQMGKRSATTELEVTEYDAPKMTRIVSDEGGTIWDTTFTCTPVEGGTEFVMVMDAKPYKLLAKIVTPMVRRMVTKAIESDMDAIKRYCEKA